MKNFLEVDIDELMHGKPSAEAPIDRDYAAMVEYDRKMMSEFGSRKRISWPDPVTKRHAR